MVSSLTKAIDKFKHFIERGNTPYEAWEYLPWQEQHKLIDYLAKQLASDSAAVTREWLVDVLGEPSLERRVEMEWWHARASPYAARWTGEVLDMRIGTGHVILRTRSEILAGKLISKLWPVLDEVNNAKGE